MQLPEWLRSSLTLRALASWQLPYLHALHKACWVLGGEGSPRATIDSLALWSLNNEKGEFKISYLIAYFVEAVNQNSRHSIKHGKIESASCSSPTRYLCSCRSRLTCIVRGSSELIFGKHRHLPHTAFVVTTELFSVVQMEQVGKWFWWKEQGSTGKDLSGGGR